MSAKGYCYDNAHMESFFGSFKSECQTLAKSLSPQKIKLALFDYIEGFYNTHRIHTALDGDSPCEFARKAVGAAAGGESTPPSSMSFNPMGDVAFARYSMERACPTRSISNIPPG